MNNFNNKKQVIRNVGAQLKDLLAKSSLDEGIRAGTAAGLAEELEHLNRGELNVVVCGEAKRGKSSLINAFLGESGLCPVDTAIATNCATIVRYGETEKIFVNFTIAGEQVRQEISRQELPDFVTEKGNPGQKRQVTLVEIFLPNQGLAGGLVLIDTPGVGGIFGGHRAVTYQTIPYSDAVLFVGSAQEPLNAPEVEFFSQRIARHTKRIVYALTHRDAVSNWRERLREDLETLTNAAGVPAGTIPGVAISNSNQMTYWETKDENAKRRSGFDELYTELSRLLANKEGILLGRAIGALLPVIQQLRLPLEAERAGLEASSTEEIEAIEAELKVMIDRARRLSSESADWISDLRSEMRILGNNSSASLQRMFNDLHSRLDEYLTDPQYLKDTAKLGSMLSADCSNGFADVVRELESAVGKIVADLSVLTSLAIDTAAVQAPGRPPSAPGRLAGPGLRPKLPVNGGFLQRFSHVGRQVAINTGGFAALGSIGGAVLGGLIGVLGGPVGIVVGAQVGTAVAGFVGSIFGIRRGIAELKERELAGVRQAVAAHASRILSEVRIGMQNDLENLRTAIENQIYKDLTRRIHEELEACKQAAAALEMAKREKQGDFGGRLRDLQNRIKRLNELEKALLEILDQYSPQAATAA